MHSFIKPGHAPVRPITRVRSGKRAHAESLETRALLAAIVVNTTVDALFPPNSGVISLRNALATANASSTPTTITFDPTVFANAQTILLNGTGFSMNPPQPVTITGPAAQLTIDGHALGTVFSLSNDTVNMSNLIIANGSNGGILNQLGSNLTLTGVSLLGNTGDGGLDNLGTAALNNVFISSNTSTTKGGGVRNSSSAHVTITNSVITSNSATEAGGIFNSATLTATNVTISGNSCTTSTSRGGGVLAFGGNTTLTNATINSNTSGDGAGFDNAQGNVTLLNTTITGNTATNDGGGLANGDRQDSGSGTITVTNCTIFGNTGNTGGGLFGAPGCTTFIANSIVAGNNLAGTGAAGPDASGSFNSLGYNLVGKTDGSIGSWNANDLQGTVASPLNAKLTPLDSYGSQMRTLVPLAGSPAINAGFNAFAVDASFVPLTTDERGYARIYNSKVDIGAVEFQPNIINLTPGNNFLTLLQTPDHHYIAWAVGASANDPNGTGGLFLITDPEGAIVNGNGASDTINLQYGSGNPLPSQLHLNGTFTLNGLTGSFPFDGTDLDLGKSTLFINYAGNPDPLATIVSYIQSSYNNGLWTGTVAAPLGVISSLAAVANTAHTTGIGYADSADGLVPLPAKTIELKYTLFGDTGLAGTVSFTDFMRMTQHFTTTTGAKWSQGDFNYDGSVNTNDFNLLKPNYGQTLPAPIPVATPVMTPIAVAPPTSPPLGAGTINSLPTTSTDDSTDPSVSAPHTPKSKKMKKTVGRAVKKPA